jgi:hypothetical protein
MKTTKLTKGWIKMNKTLLIIAILCALTITASARTKLVTLPGRDLVLLNIEHPSRNLVLEERTITLEKGLTTISFSWQGVQIDPASIQLQPMTRPDDVKLISVSYPPNENALEWQVASPTAGMERFRIYYLLSGVDRKVEYRMNVDSAGALATLKTYYRLGNRSGEDFEDSVIYTGIGQGVVKTIDNGAQMQTLTALNKDVPVVKVYKFKPFERPETVGFYYEMLNSTERGLGEFRLPGGKVRIYQESPAGDYVFMGEDFLAALAVMEKDYLNLGVARDITAKRKVMDQKRDNIRRAGSNRQMVLWDDVTHVRYELQNFKDEELEVVIEEVTSDYWEIEELSGLNARSEVKHNGLLEITVTLPPKSEKLNCDLTIRKTNQTETRL